MVCQGVGSGPRRRGRIEREGARRRAHRHHRSLIFFSFPHIIAEAVAFLADARTLSRGLSSGDPALLVLPPPPALDPARVAALQAPPERVSSYTHTPRLGGGGGGGPRPPGAPAEAGTMLILAPSDGGVPAPTEAVAAPPTATTTTATPPPAARPAQS